MSAKAGPAKHLAELYADLYVNTKDALIKRGVNREEATAQAGPAARSIVQTFLMMTGSSDKEKPPWEQ